VKRLVLAISLCLLTVTSAWAAPTRYVTDELQITLRTGPTNGHRILKMVHAGTPLEVLEQGAEGWARVRMRDGTEGWVLEQHLASTPSARDRLASATASLQKSQQELAELRQSLTGGSKQLAAAQAQIAELSTANERMKLQLQDASRGLTLSTENRDLKKQIVDLQREIEVLQNETQRLGDRSQRDWFVTGALVVFGGFLAGIIVTRIRWRKKSSWSSL
jgi:SH3 domain protein